MTNSQEGELKATKKGMFSQGPGIQQLTKIHSAMYQHQHARLPVEQLKDMPEAVVVLLEALLEKDPARRFQNPTELGMTFGPMTSARNFVQKCDLMR
jgi:hypothetical protein